jgi:RNA polymerase sigma-54 factor
MALEMRQSLKLQQSLALTPQLQQAIKLLQLNHLELVEAIQQELLENPTLEEVANTDPVETSDVERALQDKAAADGADVAEQNNGQGEDVDWESVAQQLSDHEPRERGSSGLEDLPPIETNLVARGDLAEHLAWQLQMQSCTDAERDAALHVVHNLDERGWLALPLEDLVCDNALDPEDAESALDIVQHLDPLGCGARSLEECLCIQAAVLWPGDDALQRLLREHLPDLEKRNYAGIARALGVEHEDVLEYHRMIRTLEPWPGRAFTSADPQYISPDVYVRKLGDEWVVTQNEDGLPKLRISKHYRKVLAGRDSTRAERDYIKERLGAADFLIKSIYKRQATIQRVMQCILRKQGDFFDRGPEHLRPMVLRDVAEELEVHESTVSRVTSNKYVHCPQGIFELKYFFTNGVNAVSGDQVAAEAVKRRIRRVIQDEDPANPLSDDAIVKLLVADNIDIARRTVAKYREAMGILPSSKRRNVC